MTAPVESGADESFSHPAPAVLWANGVRILAVYPGGSDPRKAVTRAYWDACVAQGIAMLLIDEHGNNQMVTGAAGFGTFVANEIIDYYEQVLGVTPADETAAYFVFADPRPAKRSEWPAIEARAREICAACLARGWVLPGDTTGSSLVGGYGDGPVLEHLYDLGLLGRRVTPTGRPYGLLFPVGTWGPSPHAAWWQDPNTTLSTLGGAIDRDYLASDVTDIGQHPHPYPLTTDTTISEDDMLPNPSSGLFQPNQLDTFWVLPNGDLVHHWYFHGGPAGTDTDGWNHETIAHGCTPPTSPPLLGPYLWPKTGPGPAQTGDGYVHVFSLNPAGEQIHAVYPTGDPKAQWTSYNEGGSSS